MKTQKTKRQGPYLQKSNNRWKWMAGATAAATAAGVSASQAGLVTINLSNNGMSASGGNHLNPDLTGDGHPDLTIANVYTNAYFLARVSLNGVQARWRFDDTGVALGYFDWAMRLGSRSALYHYNSGYYNGG